MRKLRVAVLMHEDLVPPKDANKQNLRGKDWRTEYEVISALEKLGHEVCIVSTYNELSDIRIPLKEFKPHVVFNLLVEFDGEPMFDHNIVSYLELLGVPYTGCNPRGLMLARDKAISKILLRHHGIPVADFHVVPRGQKPTLPKEFGFPVIIKSLTEEASAGISQASVVKTEDELLERVKFIHEKVETDAIVEQFIDGKEIYVGLLGNKRLDALPVWELHFKNTPEGFIQIATSRVKWNEQYREKHGIVSGKVQGLSEEAQLKVQNICKETYRVLKLSGYARIDLRYTPAGDVYVIEANPNPGIATDEEFPKSAISTGISYEDMIQKITTLGMSSVSST